MQIELRKIALRYGDKPPLLEDLDFFFAEGDFALTALPAVASRVFCACSTDCRSPALARS